MSRIRGTGSILGGVDPLYIVDGIITKDIRNINTNDIISMDILKDASSTAIYGARAANGVVLITTKSGQEGFNINYNGQSGLKILQNKVKMAGPNLFAVYSNEAAGAPTIEASDITGSTDWYEELTRPAWFHNHSISLNGNIKNYKYFLSLGYLSEDGLLLGNKYERYTIRYNHEIKVRNKLRIGNTLAISFYDSENKPYSLFTTAYIAAPIYNAKNPDGSYGFTTKSDVGNPLATLEYTNDRSYGYRPQGTLWAEYEILDGLSFRTTFGIDAEINKGWNYIPVYQVGTTTQRNEVSSLTYTTDSIYNWVWDNYITYSKTFAQEHNLKVTAGHTAERRDGWKNRAERDNVPHDKNQWELNFNDTTGQQQNFRDPIDFYYRRESYFARVNYTFRDRYLVNATYRMDANSNFAPQNRWAGFPSIGIGWIISKEGFMTSLRPVNHLKIRASYGIVGNDVIRPGQFELTPTEYLYAYFGDNYINGATVTSIVDPDLAWEEVEEFDVGLEFSLFNSSLTGEIDYYYKNANNALYTVPLPAIGFGSQFLTNAADIVNTGVEIALRWTKTFTPEKYYTISVNGSYNKNTVKNIGLGRPLNYGNLNNGWTATQTLEGEPIGSFWVYRTDGIFQTQAEIDAYPHVANAQPGDFKIIDRDNNGVIDNNDREHVGSYQPKYTLGINQSFTLNNFDFILDLYGVFGNKVYNGKKGVRYGGNYNVEYDVAMNRWTPGSNINDVPRAFNGVPYPTDYFIESGSYLKINNVTIGYNFTPFFKTSYIDRLRVYVSAQNPYVFTKYTGFTPELPGNQNEAGIELNIYPVPATYMLGVQLQLK
jgi:TonB-linked SusC/RagA family outer membrane protein